MAKRVVLKANEFMIIEGKYVGENKKSLNYINNQTYVLRVYHNSNMVRLHESNTGICAYKSLAAFLENWDNIKYLKNGKAKN